MRVKISILLLLLAFSAAFAEEKYYVCVSSFSVEKNADAMVSLLNSNGLPAFKVAAQVSGRTFFRVLAGEGGMSYSDAVQTRQVLQDSPILSRIKINGSFWVCKAETPYDSPPRLASDDESTQGIALEKNTDIPLSEEMPYSIFIRSYGEEQKARRDEERLEQQGIPSYVLKKYDDEKLFLFDLYAGAFSNQEEAQELQRKIEQMGIADTQVAEYGDIKKSVEDYEVKVESHKVSTDNGVDKAPASLSESVKLCLEQFLSLEGFEVESVYLYDLDSSRKNSVDFYKPQIATDLLGGESPFDAMNAFLLVNYKDELFGKQAELFVAWGDGTFLPLLTEQAAQKECAEPFTLDLPYGSAQGVSVKTSSERCLVLSSRDGKLLVALKATGFQTGQLESLLQTKASLQSKTPPQSTTKDGLSNYPQIKKTLFVMPDESSSELDFVFYTLSKVDEGYTAEKNYADWAAAITGHWEAKTVYFYKGERFDVAFFDLDYDYNAAYVHDIFMAEKVEGVGGHAQAVNGKAGWFLYNSSATELSFAQKSYVIALDGQSETNLSEEDFLNFASSLQIWYNAKKDAIAYPE